MLSAGLGGLTHSEAGRASLQGVQFGWRCRRTHACTTVGNPSVFGGPEPLAWLLRLPEVLSRHSPDGRPYRPPGRPAGRSLMQANNYWGIPSNLSRRVTLCLGYLLTAPHVHAENRCGFFEDREQGAGSFRSHVTQSPVIAGQVSRIW